MAQVCGFAISIHLLKLISSNPTAVITVIHLFFRYGITYFLFCYHLNTHALYMTNTFTFTPNMFYVSHTVHYKTINWSKITNKCTANVYLKIYLYIYCIDRFQLFCSHWGACYMVQQKNNVYIFQDTVIYIRVLKL
jgi:hypothetical protein